MVGTRPRAMDGDVPQTPISPSGSLRGWRPSLVWLFNHARAEDRDYLTKEDLATILGGSIDSDELDEAFEKLDSDGSGKISIEEFMEGFATFLRDTRHSEAESMRPRSVSFRRRRPVQELFYESENPSQEENKPSGGFRSTLSFLSPQNRCGCGAITIQYTGYMLLGQLSSLLLVNFSKVY